MERTWTTIGEGLVARLGRDSVEREAEQMEWQEVPEGGTLTLGFLPGAAINEAIRELEMPRVSAVAVSSFDRPEFHPGFYGIEANYANGRVRLFVLDTGAHLTPLLSDFYPS